MNCDYITLTCEIPIGALILTIGLASIGISIMLWGLAEDVRIWWSEWRNHD